MIDFGNYLYRDMLTEQLKTYEREMVMSDEERKELHEWVASGRSPYDNGNYICNDGGYPMDFVSAMRFEKEQMEWYQNLSEEEKQELASENKGTILTEAMLEDVSMNDLSFK